ncbi:MAG: GMC family oxidoreductase [Balneolaceae bacterium]|nr:GMC family oxidoreductase [Balneolaceae bacterium]MCH8548439.1 GMC family oxidoreductase [Balneolaceae bacterium]
MRLNIRAKKKQTYDAIVIGTGISGGWAAKELTEQGLQTLVLERGRDVRHVADYPTMMKKPWELPRNDQLKREEAEEYAIHQRTGYTLRESTKHWWLKDDDQPYIEKQRFDWIRGYHVGGKSLMWGRQCLRLGPQDFEANAKEGVGVDWPIRYDDLEPWYDYVEEFAGISGQAEGLPQAPDGKFLPPFEMNCVESHFRETIMEKFPGRVLTMGRFANLTQPHKGRGSCQYRNLCMRGCPYGAYFSSNSATLPAAGRTGNMTLRPHSVVSRILYDDESGRASGVEVIDAESLKAMEYYADIIFVCASCLNSTLILLNSRSNRFPDGLGNDSGQLGRNLMDHHFMAGARGRFDGFMDKYYYGRRPGSVHMPRYRNIGDDRREYLRGFHLQGGASRENWWRGIREMAIGHELKELVQTPGEWTMGLNGFGEMLPDPKNRVWLDEEKTDRWGQPALVFDVKFNDNEWKMREDMKNDAAEMLETAGFKDVATYDNPGGPGLGIHEMGTARMGRYPKTSVLNGWNQLHAVPNVFVTDGACMTSSANQNPSLTYMALTARAVHHAVDLLKKGSL